MMKRKVVPRPFLKWVGGKGQLLPEIVARIERIELSGAFHEPFVGGGALYFELVRTQRLNGKAYLSDTNPNLVEAFQVVRDHVDELICALSQHKKLHCADHYYQVRAQVPITPVDRAARVIYLNKTGYNGLYRENSRGEFNVPFGRYRNPPICDEVNLRAVSSALSQAEIFVAGFKDVLNRARPGDFVYLDPPYDPLSSTSSFTSYAKLGFGQDDQRELAGVFAKLAHNGVHALLSNSKTPLVLDLYRDFQIETVWASRAVNSRPEGRGKIPEVLVGTPAFGVSSP